MNQNAMQILNTLNTAGFEAYFCGGAVRDSLLGNEPKDTDVTTNATSEDILRLFPDSDFVGASFGVHLVKVNGEQFEVARFRVDSTYSDNRRPDSVKFTNNVAEDVTRRDFTVNALLMDADGKVTDLVGGLVDLENRVLRCVGNPDARFQEDALRLLRAVRFCVEKEFEMESNTFHAVKRNAHLVANVSVERVMVELSRMLVSGHADVAFTLLLETGLATYVMPELNEMVGCEHNSSFHPEGDVATHTRLLLAGLERGCSLTLALGCLLHDIAKPRTRGVTESGRTHFRGHENVGADMANEMLRRLKFSNEVVDTVVHLVKNHMKFFVARQMKRSTLLRFLRQPNFAELLALGRLDVGASNKDFSDVDFVANFMKNHADELTSVRLVNGNDLVAMGLMPGPNFKVWLERVETEQFEGRLTTREAALNFVRTLVPKKMRNA